MKAQDWDRRWEEHTPEPHAEPGRLFADLLKRVPPARALDIGCGDGRNAVWLAEHGWQVTGVDYSEIALGKATGLARRRRVEVEWVLADVLDWSPPAEAFELVLVLYLQLPADERRQVLAGAATAVAPGGTLLVVLSNLTEGWGGPSSPTVLCTPHDIASELPGLVIDRAERVRRTVSVGEAEHIAVDALVTATRRGA
jgi:2-polyprenyl-3-methyl-5-hydroxy-6-metoxy-1,4-benzoquinol methylase